MTAPPTVCRQCGTPNPPGNNFCGRCGTFLGARPAPDPAARPRARPDDPRTRRNIAIIYAITAIFVLTCLVLAVVVIVWRP